MINQVGIPSDSVDQVFDFVDTIWQDVVSVLLLALLEMLWGLVVSIFIDLAPVWGFALMLTFWLFMFYTKYVESPR